MDDDVRIDIYLNKNYKFSRSYSKEIIENGLVSVNGKTILKPSFNIKLTDIVKLDEKAFPKYVSRGGLKLEKAINLFNINLNDLICLDIGASTGGFTDCMLQNGAKKVYALDVGTSQIHPSLLKNDKVISLENTDIRDVDKNSFNDYINFISIDVSFISITKILKNTFNLLSNDGQVIALIKPQFEAGKGKISKNGVVKDIKVHKKILFEILDFIQNTGFYIWGLTYSPIKKTNGNIEYLVYIKKLSNAKSFDFKNINEIVETAFFKL